MSGNLTSNELITNITALLENARVKAVQFVNQTMVFTYYEIGRMLIEDEQNGKERAEYGKQLLFEVSQVLSNQYGKGFSETNLKQMRQFYIVYSKSQTLSDELKLSWSNYLKLMRIEDEKERKFYEIEIAKNNWSIREFQRHYENNEQIFASKYLTILPSRETFKKIIQETND